LWRSSTVRHICCRSTWSLEASRSAHTATLDSKTRCASAWVYPHKRMRSWMPSWSGSGPWRRAMVGDSGRMAPASRTGHVHRVTRETDVEVTFGVDGAGRADVSTGVGFLNHMLDSLSRHGLFDLEVKATGDLHVDDHHSVEDVAIAVGQAL